MPDFHRKAAPGAFDHRRAAEQSSDPRAVDGGRHDDEPEVGPQRSLHVEGERQPEIAVEGTLVEFVEEDGGNPGEFGIVEDHARQNALGYDQDAGFVRRLALHAHGKANGFAWLLAEDFRHAPGGGAGGKPARLEQQDSAVAAPCGRQQRRRHKRGLAGAGRRDQHCAVAGFKRGKQRGKRFGDGQDRQVGEVHAGCVALRWRLRSLAAGRRAQRKTRAGLKKGLQSSFQCPEPGLQVSVSPLSGRFAPTSPPLRGGEETPAGLLAPFLAPAISGERWPRSGRRGGLSLFVDSISEHWKSGRRPAAGCRLTADPQHMIVPDMPGIRVSCDLPARQCRPCRCSP